MFNEINSTKKETGKHTQTQECIIKVMSVFMARIFFCIIYIYMYMYTRIPSS